MKKNKSIHYSLSALSIALLTLSMPISFAQNVPPPDTLFATEDNERTRRDHVWNVDPFEGLESLVEQLKEEGHVIEVDRSFNEYAPREGEAFLSKNIPGKMIDACRQKIGAPQINVKVQNNGYQLYKERSFVDLNREVYKNPTSTRLQYYTFGLTHSDYEYTYEVNARFIQDGDFVCLTPRIDVIINLKPQRVDIARELPDQSCLEHEVMQHELRHVQINEENAQRMAQTLQNILHESLKDNQLVFGTINKTENWMAKLSKTKLDKSLKEIHSTLNEAHRAFDSQEESDRLLQVCNGYGVQLIDYINSIAR